VKQLTFYDSTLEYFDHARIVYHERFVPFYSASVGAHLFNLENQKREFYYEGGKIPQMRMNIFFVAPPGYLKTTILQKFLIGKGSILYGGGVPHGMEGVMTEAAFTGSIRMIDGDPTEVPGAAYEHRNGILGIDEFAALTNAMKMEHSVNLDNAMLTALDQGFVIKRLAMGKIQYQTRLSLWTGSQPCRIDLSSGLPRRLMFMIFIPNEQERHAIKLARRDGRNIRPNVRILMEIRKDIEHMKEGLKAITSVSYDPMIYKWLDEIDVPHYEEPLYERFALGMNIARAKTFDKHLTIKAFPELYKLFKMENMWRGELNRGTEFTQVFEILKEMNYATVTEVKKKLAVFGMDWRRSSDILQAMSRMSMIKFIKDENTKGGGRAKTLVVIVD